MISKLPARLLGELSDFVTTEFGLWFPADRHHELARSIAAAALELGITDVERWAETIIAGKVSLAQLRVLANHLTISETYFFRQRETFAVLEQVILPARFLARGEQKRPLTIWSAGCASGEEPYSIAILLRQLFPAISADVAKISATDINSHVLARATRGVYSEWSFRDAPPWLKSSYFTRLAHGRYEIAKVIREMVHFSQLNFALPIYPAEFSDPGDFDVILCRNVLMYFSTVWQEKILRRFVGALAVGGWLLVGPCDVSTALAAELNLRLNSPGVFEKCRPGVIAISRSDDVAEWFADPPRRPEPRVYLPTPAPTAEPIRERDESGLPTAHAQAHADRGELAEALAECDRALASAAMNPDIHYLRACILLEQNRITESAQALHRVLYLDPRSVMAEFTLGSLAEREGRSRDSRHHFSTVLRLLSTENRGDIVPRSEGLTVARLRDVVEKNLGNPVARLK